MTATLLPPALLARVARMELRLRGPAGVLPGGVRPAGRSGQGTLFREFRPYSPGDDLRYVDWNVYARHDRLVTKRFEAEEAARVVLVLDASGSMAAGEGGRLLAAARALAVAGAVALARGDRVEAVRLPGGEAHGSGRRGDVGALLEFLAAPATGGPTDLGRGIARCLPAARGRALAVVASDFLDPGGSCAGVDAARRRGWDVRALHVLARSDLEPPPGGRLLLVDAETGEERPVDLGPAEREHWRVAALGRVRAFRRALRSRGVPWTRIPAEGDDLPALLLALRRGGVLA